MGDNRTEFNFAGAAISHFKDTVGFAFASETDIPEGMCEKSPCIIPLVSSVPLDIEPAPQNPSEFLLWVERILDPSVRTLYSQEQLKMVLQQGKAELFAIDIEERPQGLPTDITVGLTPKKLVNSLGYRLESKKIYVFRPQDRQFVEYNGSLESQLADTNLLYYKDINFQNKTDYVVAFLTDANESEPCTREINILTNLSKKYHDIAYFSIIPYSGVADFAQKINFPTSSLPLFFVIDKMNPSKRRWILDDKDSMYNESYLEEFILQIRSKVIPSVVLSEESAKEEKESTLHKLVAKDFSDLVYDDAHDCFVVFTSEENCSRCKFLKPIVTGLSSLLNGSTVYFYWFDVDKNDVPENVPEITDYPTIMMWPAGKKDEIPKIYSGSNSYYDLLVFIKDCASHAFSYTQSKLDALKKKADESFTFWIGKHFVKNEEE